MSELHEAALHYVALGCRVLPLWWLEGTKCGCGSTESGHKAGKHPLTRHGVKDASRDLGEVNQWWGMRWPKANLGIATGEGVFALDIDIAHKGEESLAAMQKECGPLDTSMVCMSGGGGRHLYFRTGALMDGVWKPAVVKIGNKVAAWGWPGVDVRGDGGYLVAPPSTHASGQSYRWAQALQGLENVPLAPSWLLTLLTQTQRPTAAPTPPRASTLPTSAARLKNAEAYLAKIPYADGTGGRGGHTQTLKTVCSIYIGFDLSEEEAFRLVWEKYNPRCVPMWTEKEIRHKLRESEKSGRPRGYLLDNNKEKPSSSYGTNLVWQNPK